MSSLSSSRSLVALLAAICVFAACEPFDPAPEGNLVLPVGGKWYTDSLIEVEFTEPVVPESIQVTIWPRVLDREGDLAPGVEPLVAACRLGPDAQAQCGVFGLALSVDRQLLSVDQGGAFEGLEGKPYILELAPGLSDDAGRRRRVRSWFDFQVSRRGCLEEPVDLQLQSGIIGLVSDLSDVIAGAYLRLYVDIGVDPENGIGYGTGLMARLVSGTPPNSTDPTTFYPVWDEEGWVIHFNVCLSPLPDGPGYDFRTDVFDLDISLLAGAIKVHLADLQMIATIVPGVGPDERDTFDGFMDASSGTIDSGGDPMEVSALGAALVGYGLFPDEVPDGTPRICDPDPCWRLHQEGGGCQFPYVGAEYTPPAFCEIEE